MIFRNGKSFDLKGEIHTGLVSFVDITINVDDTKFNVTAGNGMFVNRPNTNFPIITEISWGEKIALTTPFLNTKAGSWLGIDSAGDIIIQEEDFTAQQLTTNIRIGRLSHFDRTVIDNTFNFPLFYYAPLTSSIFTTNYGTIAISGNTITANGANLKIDKSIGQSSRIGANVDIDIDNPDTPTVPAISQLPFRRAYRGTSDNSIVSAIVTDLDCTMWDDGSGTLQSVDPPNNYTIQLIWFFPNNDTHTTFLLYGQEAFATIEEALAALPTYNPVINIDLAGGNIIGYLINDKDCVDLAAQIIAGTSIILPGVIFGPSIR